MENTLRQIKDAIISQLKRIDSETDVFFEEIKGTEEKHGLNNPETYYFVDVLPIENKTVDKVFTDVRVLVDIAYHERSESNTAYLVKWAEIDAVIRPVFCFGSRHITVTSAAAKIVDHVLHYSFPINFRQVQAQTKEFETMGELEVAIRRSVN